MKKIILLSILFLCNASAANAQKVGNDSAIIKIMNRSINDSKYTVEGKSVLYNMTGRSTEARIALARVLQYEEDYKSGAMETSRQLLESAFHEGNNSAGLFLYGFYCCGFIDRHYFPINKERAVLVLRKVVANQDNSSGELDGLLGKLLRDIGKKEEAVYWLKKSIDQDYIFSASELSNIYSSDDFKDLVKAWFYSDLSGTSMAKEKHELEQQMTPEQLEQAQNMSWDWQDAHHVHMPGYRGHGSPIRWHVEYN